MSQSSNHSSSGQALSQPKQNRLADLGCGCFLFVFCGVFFLISLSVVMIAPVKHIADLIPIFFTGMGFVGMLGALWYIVMTVRKKTRKTAAPPLPKEEMTFYSEPTSTYARNEREVPQVQNQWTLIRKETHCWLPEAKTDPQEIKSSQSPLLIAVGLFLFSIFWNAIISFLWADVIAGWMRGDPPWFLTLFSIPFILVGIGMFLLAIYYFMSWFNPVPQMYVSSPSVALGDSIRLKSVKTGKVTSIRLLTLKLVGEESATYRRGTSTYTDKHVFYENELVSTTDHYEIESGDVEITVPGNLMHTLKGARNQIQWSLKLHGDIALWPDVNHAFEIIVLPSSSIISSNSASV